MPPAGEWLSRRFHRNYRASGILLLVSSLSSSYGIGDVGPTALAWVDRLREAGQSWWQALPPGPTGYGNSPYQALSSLAGNELLISPDGLIEEGLLQASDREAKLFGASRIDYAAVTPAKCRILETAWRNFCAGAHTATSSGVSITSLRGRQARRAVANA